MKISYVTKTSPPSPIQGLETSTQDGGWARTTESSSNRCISIMDLQLGGRASFVSFQIVFIPSCQAVYLFGKKCQNCWEIVKVCVQLRSLFTVIQTLVFSHLRDVYTGQKIHLSNKIPYTLAVEMKCIITGSWDRQALYVLA